MIYFLVPAASPIHARMIWCAIKILACYKWKGPSYAHLPVRQSNHLLILRLQVETEIYFLMANRMFKRKIYIGCPSVPDCYLIFVSIVTHLISRYQLPLNAALGKLAKPCLISYVGFYFVLFAIWWHAILWMYWLSCMMHFIIIYFRIGIWGIRGYEFYSKGLLRYGIKFSHLLVNRTYEISLTGMFIPFFHFF